MIEDKDDKNLQFKGGNPGAVQYGNFINYYKFHPVYERVKLLPTNIWNLQKPQVALDIGCNTGDLTMALRNFFAESLNSQIDILGLDIDPLLIERAKEMHKNDLTFYCLDIMDTTNRQKILKEYLSMKNVSKFDIIFCFSTTMWIHLNNGDDGLKQFLEYISNITKMIVIEPQPWKCYKTAIKRMKQNNFIFPHFNTLKLRENIENEVENILLKYNMKKIAETNKTSWDRKILFFKALA